MKSISDLTDFYYDELYGDLQELEKERQKIARKLITVFVILGLVAAAIMFAIYNSSGGMHDGIFFVAFAAFAIGAFAMKFMTKDYTQDFKFRIIKPMIHAIEDDLVYRPRECLSETLFKRSGIFKHRIDRYNGNDLVTGTIDGTDLRFSDVHAEYRTKDSKGRTSWHTIFHGLFIMTDFNKHFKGRTIILPDRAENLFGSLVGNWLQSKNFSREELVKMDDPTFEKHFVVYGTDQIEARYILTHSMMKRLLDFKRRSKENIFVSFIGSHIHVAVSGGDRFEPTVFKSLLSYEQAMAYIATLKLAIGIVEDLKLNQHLWSKQ
jgi:hypothetical protein